jgi:hypothetical protein
LVEGSHCMAISIYKIFGKKKEKREFDDNPNEKEELAATKPTNTYFQNALIGIGLRVMLSRKKN